MKKIFMTTLVALLSLAAITLPMYYELYGLNPTQQLVTIIDGGCAQQITARGGRGSFSVCSSTVKDETGTLHSAISNCPLYTIGWKVMANIGSSLFTRKSKYSINCDESIASAFDYERSGNPTHRLVTITGGNCSSQVASIEKSFSGEEVKISECMSTIKDETGTYHQAISNCPSFTFGWKVIANIGTGLFPENQIYSIDCRAYIDLTHTYRSFGLHDKNTLFWKKINSPILNRK
ncbi:hypothetical protein ACXJY6_12000 [Vibrio sp. RC27]